MTSIFEILQIDIIFSAVDDLPFERLVRFPEIPFKFTIWGAARKRLPAVKGRAKPTMAWAMSERRARTSIGMVVARAMSVEAARWLTAVLQFCEKG